MLGIAVPKAGLGLKLLLKATSTPAVLQWVTITAAS